MMVAWQQIKELLKEISEFPNNGRMLSIATELQEFTPG